MTDDNADGSKSFRHSFHLPNFFSRGHEPAASGALYAPVSSNEDNGMGDDGEYDDGNGHPNGGVMGSETGAESCDVWLAISASQKILFRASFCVFGASVLLPFNAVITPSEYYRATVGPEYSASVISWIIVAYNISSIVFGAHAATSMEKTSISRRIVLAASLIIVILGIATGMTTFLPSKNAGTSALILFVLLASSLAGLVAYLQMAVVTLANAWGPSFMGLMLAGQGVVGLVVSAIQLGAAMSSSSAPAIQLQQEREARAASQFFGANTLLMALALASYAFVARTHLFREVVSRQQRDAKLQQAAVHGTRQEEEGQVREEEQESRSISGLNRYLSPETRKQYGELRRTQAKVMIPCLALAYVFVVTLTVFPALTSRVRPWSSTSSSSQTLIFVAWHFVAFNACDLIGRTVPTLFPTLFSRLLASFLLLSSLARTALVPLLLACHIPNPRPNGPNISSSSFGDAAFFILVGLLGLSNGLVATSIFVTAPRSSSLQSEVERGRAAALLSWWLTVGLAVGSLISFAF